ncbi:Uncharacterised protein [Mycobacteroides abscessus subsp. abscessus]|nr:Uncharacterised protein [Mycobacteroides abscessus subsp. abscessus]
MYGLSSCSIAAATATSWLDVISYEFDSATCSRVVSSG